MPDADRHVPTWHVARAEAYDTTGVRTSALDDSDWDIDEDTSSEEFESNNPSDHTVAPESQGDEPGIRD